MDRRLRALRQPAGGPRPRRALLPVRPLPADRLEPSRRRSRPTCRASGTQDLDPAWDSKYTININTEMNYWPAELTNLGECHEPLFDMIDELRRHRPRDGQGPLRRARLGAPPQHRPLARHGADQRLQPRHLADGGALALPRTSGSTTCSPATASSSRERAYPVMREAAEFFLDCAGRRTRRRAGSSARPSNSPEHRAAWSPGRPWTTRSSASCSRTASRPRAILGVGRGASPRELETPSRGSPPTRSAGTASSRSGWRTCDDPNEHAPPRLAPLGPLSRRARSRRAGRPSWSTPRAQSLDLPRRRRHRLEPGLEDQLLGPASCDGDHAYELVKLLRQGRST